MNASDFLILPTYNERKNIRELVLLIFKLHPELNILVVDDNSPDGTADEIRELQKKISRLHLLLREKKEGLGRAYIGAFKELMKNPEVSSVIMMDADFSHNPKYLSRMFEEIENYDLVIGSRYLKGGGIEKWEKWRRFLSWGGNIYCRSLLNFGISDWTAGFNCIRMNLLRKIDLNKLDFSGYAFIIGLKYHLFKVGARVKEIPIVFEARKEGESKISNHIIKEGILAPWKLIFSRTKK